MEPLSNDPLSGILVLMLFLTIWMKLKIMPDEGAKIQAKLDEQALREELKKQKKSHPNETRTQQGGLIEEEG